MSIKNNQRFETLLEDCQAIWVEHDFQSRWFRIKGYHKLGKILLEEPSEYGDRFVPLVAESIGKSTRTVYRTIEFAKLFPELDLLSEGKNTSWYQIINKYIPQLKSHEEKIIVPLMYFEGQLKYSIKNGFGTAILADEINLLMGEYTSKSSLVEMGRIELPS